MNPLDPIDDQITVLIPTRDRPEMIARLLAQFEAIWPEVRILVSDNFSRQDAEARVAEFLPRLRLTYFKQPRPLPGPEHGVDILRRCPTRYGVFFCDDDLITPAFRDVSRLLARTMAASAEPISLAFAEGEILLATAEESNRPELASRAEDFPFTPERMLVFPRREYVRYFARVGRGGNFGGMLLDVADWRANGPEFPTAGGNRNDKLFALSVNRTRGVIYYPGSHHHRVEHATNDVFNNVAANHLLFLRAVNGMFADDEALRVGITAMRLRHWIREYVARGVPVPWKDFPSLWKEARPGLRGIYQLFTGWRKALRSRWASQAVAE